MTRPAGGGPEVIAEASARLASDLIGEISHDLRSPLGAILLWAKILRQTPPGHPDASSALEMIDRSAAQLMAQLDDMTATCVSLTGTPRPESEPTDLAALAEAASEAARSQALDRDVLLEVVRDQRVDAIHVIPAWLRLALDHVIGGLVHDAPRGATIEVRVDAAEDGARCRVTMTSPGLAPGVAPPERSRRSITRARLARRLVENQGGQLLWDESAGLGYIIHFPLT